jgi:hypothetical protein
MVANLHFMKLTFVLLNLLPQENLTETIFGSSLGCRDHAVIDAVRTIGGAEPRTAAQIVGSSPRDAGTDATGRQRHINCPRLIHDVGRSNICIRSGGVGGSCIGIRCSGVGICSGCVLVAPAL